MDIRELDSRAVTLDQARIILFSRIFKIEPSKEFEQALIKEFHRVNELAMGKSTKPGEFSQEVCFLVADLTRIWLHDMQGEAHSQAHFLEATRDIGRLMQNLIPAPVGPFLSH